MSVIRPCWNRLRSRSSMPIWSGGAVGRQHDLPAGLVQVVEGVEELLDRLLLALEELHVVDQQHVDVAVAALEGVAAVGVHRVDELVEERLRGDVAHLVGRVVVVHVAGDGLQQVGLAQAGVAVDEERVELAGRHLGHRLGGGVGEAVGPAGHEVLERVAGVQLDVAARRRRVGVSPSTPAAARVGALARSRPPGPGRAGGLPSRRGDGPERLGLGRVDLEAQHGVGGAGLDQRVADEAQVAALDALLGQGDWHAEREGLAVVVHRPDALERRVPDRVGHLGSQEGRAHVPQAHCIAHHVAPPPAPVRVSTASSTLVEDCTRS